MTLKEREIEAEKLKLTVDSKPVATVYCDYKVSDSNNNYTKLSAGQIQQNPIKYI